MLFRRPGNRAVRHCGRQGQGDLAGPGLAIKTIGRIPTLHSVGPDRVTNEVLGKLQRALRMFGLTPYSVRLLSFFPPLGGGVGLSCRLVPRRQHRPYNHADPGLILAPPQPWELGQISNLPGQEWLPTSVRLSHSPYSHVQGPVCMAGSCPSLWPLVPPSALLTLLHLTFSLHPLNTQTGPSALGSPGIRNVASWPASGLCPETPIIGTLFSDYPPQAAPPTLDFPP